MTNLYAPPATSFAVPDAATALRPFLPQLVEGICLALAVLDQLVAILSERRQSLGDLLAGTIVVDRNRARTTQQPSIDRSEHG